jgi:BirA family transcriptional regulator, biotin operon repressor / biotin---[acetyl-CoA-carboxylase] ligase
MFDLPSLNSALAESVYAGKLHFAAITDSTNTDAMAAGREGAPHGSVYFADEQRAGRGRGDHAWHSAGGQGLYVSVLLRPSIPAARMALLPLAAGLAAAAAVKASAGLEIDLRWPNDLLIGPRKTGGILVESRLEAGGIAFAVVGIGINVHQREFPADVSTAATSLDLESGKTISRQTVLIELLKAVELEWNALGEDAAVVELPRRVGEASTWISGRRVDVHGPQACSGNTDGLDGNGFLRVITAGGLVTVQTGGLRDVEGERR